jgi:periplasmic copper chaperone A
VSHQWFRSLQRRQIAQAGHRGQRRRVPEDAAGETLYFPVIQECAEGQTGWVELPEAGSDGEELESPAPAIVVSAPSDTPGDGATTDTTQASTTAETVTASATPAATTAESSSNGIAIAALVVGGLGVALGGAALATRKR